MVRKHMDRYGFVRESSRRDGLNFEYGPWLRQFIASVQWRVMQYLESLGRTQSYTQAEYDEWNEIKENARKYLLGLAPAPASMKAFVHCFTNALGLRDQFPPGCTPRRLNMYLLRSVDFDVAEHKSGMKIMFVKLGPVNLVLEMVPGALQSLGETEIKESGIYRPGEVPSIELYAYFYLARPAHLNKATRIDSEFNYILRRIERDPMLLDRESTFAVLSTDIALDYYVNGEYPDFGHLPPKARASSFNVNLRDHALRALIKRLIIKRHERLGGKLFDADFIDYAYDLP